MAGTACGALAFTSLGAPHKRLRVTGALLLLTLLSSFLVYQYEPFYYVLICLVGIAVGAEFSATVQLMTEQGVIDAAGRFYAFDLAGGVLGALATTLLFVPLFGIVNTLLFVVLLKAAAVAMLFRPALLRE